MMLILHRKDRANLKGTRSGVAAVEFALIAPVLALITMGMLEIGRAIIVQQTLVNVSREGARLAVRAATSTADVIAFANDELAIQGISNATVSTSPANLAAASEGTPVTVIVDVPAASISWVPNPLFTLNTTLTAETTMRRESS